MSQDQVADSLIPYDEIVQEALRGVVRAVLERIAAEGLPGEHHFYIAFKTNAPGVEMPKHLLARYPEEMTIVLQNKYWDLKADDDGFQVGLTFAQVPAKLRIPYAAVTGFVDPSVNFALQFQAAAAEPPPPPEPEPAPLPEGAGANVVALDRFRKK